MRTKVEVKGQVYDVVIRQVVTDVTKICPRCQGPLDPTILTPFGLWLLDKYPMEVRCIKCDTFPHKMTRKERRQVTQRYAEFIQAIVDHGGKKVFEHEGRD